MCTDLNGKLQVQQSNQPQDLTQQFNTQLSTAEEASFQAWAKTHNKLNDMFDYDLRGAWKDGVAGVNGEHSPDTYKKPNHPTFSKESKYNGVNGKTGGEWVDTGNGQYQFKASQTNVDNLGETGLQQYFNKVEKGNTLVLPKQRK